MLSQCLIWGERDYSENESRNLVFGTKITEELSFRLVLTIMNTNTYQPSFSIPSEISRTFGIMSR